MPKTLLQNVGKGVLAGAIIAVMVVAPLTASHAQQQQKAAAAAKSAAESKPKTKRLSRKQAEAELREGYRALKAKETKQAIAALTRALDAGSLRRKEMAKALYYRGTAYRTSERTAEAISDLTSSLWLKGALTKEERADALKQRKLAYSSAGVGAGLLSAPSSSSTVVGPETGTNTDRPPGKKPKQAQKTKSSGAGSWKSTTATSSVQKTSGSSGASSPVAGVTSFFSNLFTPSPQTNSPSQSRTAALSKPNRDATSTSVSSWSSKQAKKAPATARRAAPRPAAAKSEPAKPAGNYQIQVASYRNRSRADAVARRITKNFGGLLSGRQPVVEQSVVSGMGQFYQVRIKRYRNAREPAALCKKLIAGGLDCFVRRGK